MAKAKQIPGIDCDAEAAAAIRLVATVRLGEMCAFRERALDSSDREGVHDMRVASRRLRSALRDFLPYVRKRGVVKPLQEIKEIADALGQVRDQDVAIIALEKLATKAPAEVSTGIHELADIRRARRAEAGKELIPILDQACLTQLESDFLPALSAALTPASGRKKSRQSDHSAGSFTYRQVACATILDRLNELEKLSDSLYHPLKIKRLHRMRIAAKRLRYAVELFEKCWGQQLGLFARKVSALQSSLGELHDCDVWILDFGNDLSGREKDATSRTEDPARVAASLWLFDHFVKLRTTHLRHALARWQEWETNDLSAQLRQIVQSNSSAPSTTASATTIAATEAAGLT